MCVEEMTVREYGVKLDSNIHFISGFGVVILVYYSIVKLYMYVIS